MNIRINIWSLETGTSPLAPPAHVIDELRRFWSDCAKNHKSFRAFAGCTCYEVQGWSGGAKVSCILCHLGVQLILAYSWARPAILVAGKGREVIYFFCFFTFIPVPLSSLSLSFISSAISSVSFLPFFGRRHKMTHKGWRVVKPQHNQINQKTFYHFNVYLFIICFIYFMYTFFLFQKQLISADLFVYPCFEKVGYTSLYMYSAKVWKGESICRSVFIMGGSFKQLSSY